MEQAETKSGFLFKNLIRGFVWFGVLITAFILAEDYLQDNFQKNIGALYGNPAVLYSIFFSSEVIFGLVPPEFFMMIWILNKVTLSDYIINLTILTGISYTAGIIGYYIGKNFSKTAFYRKVSYKYLRQYQKQLRQYGGYLVFVGAVTPVPFSAMCMLAGSVNLPFKDFLLICITRVLRFAVYGWMVWSFPNWFANF